MENFTRRQFVGSLTAGAALPPIQRANPQRKPNIVLILADDLGYSDLGCFGGEIRTPNLDALASRGIRFTQFYNSARCCPSRASLLSGLYPHQAGVGDMTRDEGLPGYRGHLSQTCVTIPEVLRTAGYATLMSGKWHLSKPGPMERGFEEYYGMLHGFDSFWDASKYTRLPSGRPTRNYTPGTFYATDAITDYAVDFLEAAHAAGRPFFLYLAYNAPHFPLHAPRQDAAKYLDLYRRGWDHVRETRYQRMKEMKLLPRPWPLSPRAVIAPSPAADRTGWSDKQVPAWNSLDADRREDLARRMAIYAAMGKRLVNRSS